MDEWGVSEDENTPSQWVALQTDKMTALPGDVKEIWAVVKPNDLNKDVCNHSPVMETSPPFTG